MYSLKPSIRRLLLSISNPLASSDAFFLVERNVTKVTTNVPPSAASITNLMISAIIVFPPLSTVLRRNLDTLCWQTRCVRVGSLLDIWSSVACIGRPSTSSALLSWCLGARSCLGSCLLHSRCLSIPGCGLCSELLAALPDGRHVRCRLCISHSGTLCRPFGALCAIV